MFIIPNLDEQSLLIVYDKLKSVLDKCENYMVMIRALKAPSDLPEIDKGVFSDIKQTIHDKAKRFPGFGSDLKARFERLAQVYCYLDHHVKDMQALEDINILFESEASNDRMETEIKDMIGHDISMISRFNLGKSWLLSVLNSKLYKAYQYAIFHLDRLKDSPKLEEFILRSSYHIYNQLLCLKCSIWSWVFGLDHIITKWIEQLESNFKKILNSRSKPRCFISVSKHSQVTLSQYILEGAQARSYVYRQNEVLWQKDKEVMLKENFEYWLQSFIQYRQKRHMPVDVLSGYLSLIPGHIRNLKASSQLLKWRKQFQLEGAGHFYDSSWCDWVSSRMQLIQAWSGVSDDVLAEYIEDMKFLKRHAHKAFGWYSRRESNQLIDAYKAAMVRVGFELSSGKVYEK